MDPGTLALVAFGSAGALEFASSLKEAKAVEREGDIVEREALEERNRALGESERFRTTQKLAFLKSGVSLAGSPLLVLKDTEEEGKRFASSILNRGIAQKDLAKMNASAIRSKGRASLIGGFAQGGLAKATLAGPASGIPASTSLRSFFNV